MAFYVPEDVRVGATVRFSQDLRKVASRFNAVDLISWVEDNASDGEVDDSETSGRWLKHRQSALPTQIPMPEDHFIESHQASALEVEVSAGVCMFNIG